MTKKQEQQLKQCFEYTIWMAIRYAHGRSTYAPLDGKDNAHELVALLRDEEYKLCEI
jgi:hypothetical protein